MSDVFPWNVLGLIALILLIVYFKCPRKNAVWGGLIIGGIMGALTSVFQSFYRGELIWAAAWKGAILGTLIGFGAELLGMIADLHKK